MSGPELATTIAAALKILNPPRAPAAEEAERDSPMWRISPDHLDEVEAKGMR